MTQYQNQVLSSLISSKNSSKKNLHIDIYVFQNHDNLLSEIILDAVAALGEGFVVDICKKAIEAKLAGKKDYLSEKQAWCIVYAYAKISDEALTEWYLNYSTEVEESVEESVEETSSEVRVWSYNAERHILNVHYTDGSQIAVIARPTEMRDVYKARRAGDRAEVDRLISQLANTCSRLEAEPIIAENENLALLKQQLDLGILDEESTEEYHNLLKAL
jgi:hypothetical protein